MSSEKKTKHSKKWSCSNEQAATKTTATSSSSRYRDSSAKPYYCVLKLLLQSLLLPVPQLLLEVLIFKKIGRMVTSQVQLHSWHEDILGCKGSFDRSIDGDMIYGWDRRTKERVNLHKFFLYSTSLVSTRSVSVMHSKVFGFLDRLDRTNHEH